MSTGRRPPLIDGDDAGGGTGINLAGDAGPRRSDVDLGNPFALYGLAPSHGPFTGGTSARLTGRGFRRSCACSSVEQEVVDVSLATRPAPSSRRPPASPAGSMFMIRDDATAKERVLKQGFFYDSFVVTPDSGATSGGTRIARERRHGVDSSP